MTLTRRSNRRRARAAAAVMTASVSAAAIGLTLPSSASASGSGASSAIAGQQDGTALLRVGSRGLEVRQWQDLVNRAFTGGIATIDHPVLVVDGVFGPATASATRAVQAAAGIVRDGVVGPVTRAALPGLLPGAAPAEAPASAERRLSVGFLGGDVVDWQRVVGGLSSAGEVDTPRLALDGVFGPATRAGTIAVQERLGVTQDGIVGPVTRAGAAELLAGGGQGVQAAVLDEAAAERAEPGDWTAAAPVEPPLLDPCAGGTDYPRDAERTAKAAVSLTALREAGGTDVRQTVARYTDPAAAADAAAGYERAVRGCPGGGDGPRYEVVRSDQDGNGRSVVIRLVQGGGIYASYVAVQQRSDLVSVLSVAYGEDGDPGVQAIEPYLPEVTADLRRG